MACSAAANAYLCTSFFGAKFTQISSFSLSKKLGFEIGFKFTLTRESFIKFKA